MKVFVLMGGERGEGGGVIGVFATRLRARKALDFVVPIGGRVMAGWEISGSADHRKAGCDWWSIEEWEVDPPASEIRSDVKR